MLVRMDRDVVRGVREPSRLVRGRSLRVDAGGVRGDRVDEVEALGELEGLLELAEGSLDFLYLAEGELACATGAVELEQLGGDGRGKCRSAVKMGAFDRFLGVRNRLRSGLSLD